MQLLLQTTSFNSLFGDDPFWDQYVIPEDSWHVSFNSLFGDAPFGTRLVFDIGGHHGFNSLFGDDPFGTMSELSCNVDATVSIRPLAMILLGRQ